MEWICRLIPDSKADATARRNCTSAELQLPRKSLLRLRFGRLLWVLFCTPKNGILYMYIPKVDEGV